MPSPHYHIAVTGATGHIGANITRALADAGHSVRALFHQPDKCRALERVPVELRHCDVLDTDSLRSAFQGIEIVVHLAGKISLEGDPDGSVWKANVEGTQNVVQACMETSVRRLIHFSSIHAFKYLASDPMVTENHPPADDNGFAYDRSKAAGEREALKGVHHGLEVIVFNPTAVIGPYDYWNAYSGQLLRDLMRGRLPALVRGGFDWADARDLAAATLAALSGGRSGERYILSGHWASARRLAELCAVHSGKNPALPELPIWAALLGLPFLRLYSRLSGRRPLYTYESIMVLKHSNRNCSHEKARRELGYAPRPLEETIRDIYEWYKREGYV